MYKYLLRLEGLLDDIVTNESAETVARFISHAKGMLQDLEENN